MTAFSHIGVCVRDLERSLAFYQEALGFEEVAAFDVGPEFAGLLELDGVRLESRMLVNGGTTIELLHYSAPGTLEAGARRPMNLPGLTHLSFRVDDVEAAAAEIARLGGSVVDGTRTSTGPGLDFVYCTDPDGTRIELMRIGS
jgi:lactoylglutathione lyase